MWQIPLILIGVLLTAGPAAAQDLQPRRWSHLPIGSNALGVGFTRTDADIFVDPVLSIVDASMDLQLYGAKYVHSFEMLGKSARFDVIQGYADVSWSGLLEGQPASTSRSGLTDTTLRLSTQLLGAPPLKGKEFKDYRAAVAPCETILGAGLAVTLPTGEYFDDRLLNLGSNRFTFRPQLGVVHNRGKWSTELTGSAWFYTDNTDFFGGKTLENDPLYTLQGHLVYTFRPGLFLGAGLAYGIGKEATIDGVGKEDRREALLYGVSAGLPINRQIGVNLAYIWRENLADIGEDAGTFALGFSFVW